MQYLLLAAGYLWAPFTRKPDTVKWARGAANSPRGGGARSLRGVPAGDIGLGTAAPQPGAGPGGGCTSPVTGWGRTAAELLRARGCSGTPHRLPVRMHRGWRNPYQFPGALPGFLHLPVGAFPQRLQELVAVLEVVLVVVPLHRLFFHQRPRRLDKPLGQRSPRPRRPLHGPLRPRSRLRHLSVQPDPARPLNAAAPPAAPPRAHWPPGGDRPAREPVENGAGGAGLRGDPTGGGVQIGEPTGLGDENGRAGNKGTRGGGCRGGTHNLGAKEDSPTPPPFPEKRGAKWGGHRECKRVSGELGGLRTLARR